MADTMYDKAISMGWRSGGKQGFAVLGSLTAADYVNRRAGAFVKFSTGRAVTLGSTDTAVSGWLCMGKETTANLSKLITSDEYFVITDRTAVFEIPVFERTASLSVNHVGKACYLQEEGSTTTTKQYAKMPTGTCATPVLLIRDIDLENKTVFVSMNPDNLSVA